MKLDKTNDIESRQSDPPWCSGPEEILSHGVSLLKHDSDSNRRLAMLSIDNAVELMIKTYLSLPSRVTGIKLGRKDYEEISQSFPRLLDALHERAPDKLRHYDISEIEWFHRLRNELYHQGNGLTVERQKVETYAEIASGIFLQLFGRSPRVPLFTALDTESNSETHQVAAGALKGWFFIPEQGCFAATANAKGSCSLRTFDSPSGRLLKKQHQRGNYQDAFQEVLRNAKELHVRRQPNLERDCRPRLPADILTELQRQIANV